MPLFAIFALGVVAIVTVDALAEHADSGRKAQVRVGQLKTDLGEADGAAWAASGDVGGDPIRSHQEMRTGELAVSQGLAELRERAPLAVLAAIEPLLRTNFIATERIYAVGSTRGYGAWINHLGIPQTQTELALIRLMNQANREYASSAAHDKSLAIVGSALTVLVLLLAFAFVYRRAVAARNTAEALADENARLAELNRQEAVTDSLTGLRNRRALIEDLSEAIARSEGERPLWLALFDLDGFKQYNDTFGHMAGDALLVRLADQLTAACGDLATAYRMGGDEFCVVADGLRADGGAALIRATTGALSETGEYWEIECSAGVVWLPTEAGTPSEALDIADGRMYAEKAARAYGARRPSRRRASG